MPVTDDKKTKKYTGPVKVATMKTPFDPSNVELTQKIDVDYDKVVKSTKRRKIFDFNTKPRGDETITGSSLGKSIFSRKVVTDDYVRSSTVLSAIHSIPPLEDDLQLLDVNHNYDLKDQFSEGAQGVIRTAFDKSLKRDIVVKSLKRDEDARLAKKDENLFVSEARIMAQLDHPSIIPLYGLHCGAESRLHLAMKHIHGKTLMKYLRDITTLYEREGVDSFDEKRSITNRIEYIIKVCEAVDYAHCKGVIHRDLKPENIMIGNYGEVYVMDWGLACLIDPEKMPNGERTTQIGAYAKNELVGTPCYIAPELVRGGTCSPQSDIFSLGMILFEVVTLERAVPGKQLNEVLKNIVSGNFRPFRHRFLKKKVPSDLKAIISKATCDSLTHRYRTAGEMARDLKFYLMSEETVARPDNIFRKAIRLMVNYKMVTAIVVMSILLCLSGIAISSLYSQNQLMKEQELREAMLTSFQGHVSQQANKMEQVFFYFNTQLENLAYRAGNVLNSPADPNIKVYRLSDFQGSSPPPDFIYSPAYGIKISLDYPIFKRAVMDTPLDTLDKRVVGLTPMFRHIMFTSAPEFKDEKDTVVREVIMDRGAPIIWVTLGLKNGTMFAYPGARSYASDYDPRTRPWYKKALTQKEPVWSEPFRCAVSSKMIMSTIMPVFSENKNLLGVAGLHIRLDYIQKYIFGNEMSGVKEYLIDRNGNIILSSDFRRRQAVINQRSTKMILKKFPFVRELREAVNKNKVQFEVSKYNTKYIFAFYRISSMGYYYIQQVNERRLRSNWIQKQ